MTMPPPSRARRHERLSLTNAPVLAGLALSSLLPAPCVAKAPPGRFVVKVDAADKGETVFDNATKLTWQRKLSAGNYTRAGAKTYCDGLFLAGSKDWRLPNLRELRSLVDRSERNPSIDTTAFPGTHGDWFWSASARQGSSSIAWYVDFSIGSSGGSEVVGKYRARCVR